MVLKVRDGRCLISESEASTSVEPEQSPSPQEVKARFLSELPGFVSAAHKLLGLSCSSSDEVVEGNNAARSRSSSGEVVEGNNAARSRSSRSKGVAASAKNERKSVRSPRSARSSYSFRQKRLRGYLAADLNLKAGYIPDSESDSADLESTIKMAIARESSTAIGGLKASNNPESVLKGHFKVCALRFGSLALLIAAVDCVVDEALQRHRAGAWQGRRLRLEEAAKCLNKYQSSSKVWLKLIPKVVARDPNLTLFPFLMLLVWCALCAVGFCMHDVWYDPSKQYWLIICGVVQLLGVVCELVAATVNFFEIRALIRDGIAKVCKSDIVELQRVARRATSVMLSQDEQEECIKDFLLRRFLSKACRVSKKGSKLGKVYSKAVHHPARNHTEVVDDVSDQDSAEGTVNTAGSQEASDLPLPQPLAPVPMVKSSFKGDNIFLQPVPSMDCYKVPLHFRILYAPSTFRTQQAICDAAADELRSVSSVGDDIAAIHHQLLRRIYLIQCQDAKTLGEAEADFSHILPYLGDLVIASILVDEITRQLSAGGGSLGSHCTMLFVFRSFSGIAFYVATIACCAKICYKFCREGTNKLTSLGAVIAFVGLGLFGIIGLLALSQRCFLGINDSVDQMRALAGGSSGNLGCSLEECFVRDALVDDFSLPVPIVV